MVTGSAKYGPSGGISASLITAEGLTPQRKASLARLANMGLAKKTWGSYKTAEKMWRLCEKRNGVKMELPWGRSQVFLFIDWLISDRGVSAATVNAYLSGIRKIHEIHDLPEPNLRAGLVKQILQGKKNEEAIAKRRGSDKGRLPVTVAIMELLKETIRTAEKPPIEKLLLWAVSTVAFHGSFRIHEILCQSETEFDPDFTLMEADVAIKQYIDKDTQQKTMLVFAIKSPKENKTGKITLVDIHETGGPTCPVRAFLKWKNKRTNTGCKVLFRDNKGTPLTGRKFNVLLKQLLGKHIDYTKGKITSHSFRSGIPSILGELGHNDDDIKAVGRWSSRSFELYTKLPRTSRAAVAEKLGPL